MLQPADWINMVSAICAAVSAAAAFWTVREARRASKDAKKERDADRQGRRQALLRKIVPALHHTLQDAREASAGLTGAFHPTLQDLHLPFAARLLDLDADLGLVNEGDAAKFLNALERVRRYEACVSALRVMDFEAAGKLRDLLAQVEHAVQDAIRPYSME